MVIRSSIESLTLFLASSFLVTILYMYDIYIISTCIYFINNDLYLPNQLTIILINYYAEPLTYLINQSISQGIFPEELKLAKVLPIFKCEDEQLVQNYRPISILPFFLKFDDTSVFIEGTNYDKIIYILNKELKRLDIWLNANKLIIHI